jgi:hypothetical protein
VMHCNVSFLTPVLVDVVMLSHMEAVRRIASLMKSLSHTIQFDKICVISISKY